MNLFELYAVLSLDNKGYKDNLNESESLTESVGNKIQSVLGKLVTLEAIEKAGSALVNFGKQSLEAYADYEQLAGGAELLWGEAYEFVANKAKNAYQTVQMSQNDYLQQMNGFSTGLKESLGGDAKLAAELADKIITAQADVVSATGVSQEAVQNAFNGIMKSNYTMLDNLQLGITPTKEGMQEVIDKMNEWNKAQGNATNYQMGNLADMESAIVDYVAYVGMSGYAQMEASETIQGSLAMTKSAWSNFLTALADPKQSTTEALKGVYTSVQALANNVIPVINEIAPAMVDGLSMIGNLLMQEAPKLIKKVAPTLISSVKDLVLNVIANLPKLMQTALDLIPEIIGSAGELIKEGIPTLIQSLTDMIPILTESLTEIMLKLAEGLPENLPVFIENILSMVQTFATTLAENAQIILQAGITLMMALLEGIINALPTIIEQLPTIISTFANIINDNMPTILAVGVQIIITLVKGIIDSIPVIIENLPQIIAAIWDTITAINWLALGGNIMTFFKNGITGSKGNLIKGAKELIEGFKGGFKELPNAMKTIAKQVIDGFIAGIKSNITNVVKTITGLATSVIDTVRSVFGIASPSKEFKKIGSYLAQGLEVGWDDGITDVKKSMTSDLNFSAVPVEYSTRIAGTNSNKELIDALANAKTNVTVVLQGDAKRMFKVMQGEAELYNNTTGRPAFS